MSRAPGVVVHADKDSLAQASADRLISVVLEAQSSRGMADIVLTGGGMGGAILTALGASSARDSIDWRQLRVWWGDERFLPTGDPDRNQTQADEALLSALPLDPANVHPMPASDGPDGADLDAAAARYAAELAAQAPSGQDVPAFDVLMLGVGPDAHVASLFPESPGLHDTEHTVIGVRGAPKPPPTRISLTFAALGQAKDVWFLVSGADKAGAVGLALSGAGRMQAPATGVIGTRQTLWLLDRPAARHVPTELIRPAGV